MARASDMTWAGVLCLCCHWQKGAEITQVQSFRVLEIFQIWHKAHHLTGIWWWWKNHVFCIILDAVGVASTEMHSSVTVTVPQGIIHSLFLCGGKSIPFVKRISNCLKISNNISSRSALPPSNIKSSFKLTLHLKGVIFELVFKKCLNAHDGCVQLSIDVLLTHFQPDESSSLYSLPPSGPSSCCKQVTYEKYHSSRCAEVTAAISFTLSGLRGPVDVKESSSRDVLVHLLDS